MRLQMTLTQRIMNELGTGARINTEYEDVLDPFAKFGSKRSPIQRAFLDIGMLPRVTRKFLPAWINIGTLAKQLSKHTVDKHLINELRDPILAALSKIGTDSYASEWKDQVAQHQVEETIEASTGITLLMNRLVNETSDYHVYNIFKEIENPNLIGVRQEYVVMDLGTSRFGNTVVSHLRRLKKLAERIKIPSHYSKKVVVLLVDIDPEATYHAEKRIRDLAKRGIIDVPSRIERINSNFGDLHNNNALSSGYEGRVDSILSGAALLHVTDLAPVFSFLHYLSSNRSASFIWDWHTICFGGEYLRLSKDGKNRTIYELSDGDSLKTFEFSIDDELPDELFVELSKGSMRTVFEVTHEQIGSIAANARAWMAYWGFANFDGNGHLVTEAKIDAPDYQSPRNLSDHFLHELYRRLETERGFGFLEDFAVNMIWQNMIRGNLPVSNRETRYRLIEGYGDSYASIMRNVGFGAVDVSFDSFSCNDPNHSSLYDLEVSDAQKRVKDAMRFTFACRNREYFDQLFGGFVDGR